MKLRVELCLLCLASLSACGNGNQGTAENGGVDDGDTSGHPLDSGSDEGADVAMAWWRLDADLQVVKGIPALDESVLDLTIFDTELTAGCTARAPVAEASLLEELPDGAGLVVGWSLVPGQWEVDCEDGSWTDWFSDLDSGLSLGVGPLGTEILAVLDSLSGIGEGAENSLNGAYATYGESDWVTYGAAGPAAAFQGEGLPVEAPPIPDGGWYFRGLFAFSL